MPKTQYPKPITFRSVLDDMRESTNPDGLNPGITALLRSVKISMPAENILQIDYPEEGIIKEVSVATIEGRNGIIVEIVGNEKFGFLRTTLSPRVPWTEKTFFGKRRHEGGVRTDSPGRVTIIYPPLQEN